MKYFRYFLLISFYSDVYSLTTENPWVKRHGEEAQNASLRREIMEKIIPLGKSLQMMVEKLPKNEGEKLMRDLDELNKLYEEFLNLVKADKVNSKNEVVFLHDKSYPHLVDTDFSEEDMKNNFNWTSRELEDFYKKRVKAYDHYIDLQIYNNWYH